MTSTADWRGNRLCYQEDYVETYRSVILGCGPRARWHAQAYRHVMHGEVVACCDTDPARRESFARDFELMPYADAETMIREVQPDLIHVVTAPSTRVPLLTMIHELGVPGCLVEKPIATESRDWRALVALEAASSTKFGVGAQVRYHPNLVRCREAVTSGELGEVRFVDASAVGTICDQGVHVIDWTMSLIGDAPVVEVFGSASGDGNLDHHMHPSPDTTVAKLSFVNGVRALWNLGATAPRVCDDPAYYKHCRVVAYGDRGHVTYEEFGRWEIMTPKRKLAGHAEDQGWAAGNDLAQAALTDAMFEWLDDSGKPVGTSLERSLAQWNAVLGLYASTVWRRPVALPFDPPDDLWEQLVAALSTS